MMVQVRDGDKLIAVGYFDKGKTAIAGILNMYHPDYKQYSPGKFLMLKKLEYALSQGYDFLLHRLHQHRKYAFRL